MAVKLLGPDGRPLKSSKRRSNTPVRTESQEVQLLRAKIKGMIRAKFDAAQTFVGNEEHWGNADHLDPNSAASLHIRRVLRARSRYEVVENNSYLKGIILTICNDFVGSGPKLKITDKRISPARRLVIEQKWTQWAKLIKLRQKLWRMRMAKVVDGETFLRTFVNRNRWNPNPILLDFQVLECDRISSLSDPAYSGKEYGEIDGVRFDKYDQPLYYHVMNHHPGGGPYFSIVNEGKWVPAEYMVHWFRQDRGWLRGIPELVTSLPLCALLRRYTLAVVRHAETAADLTAIVESEAPPGTNPWTDGAGNQVIDDPFDVFPIEMGMITNLPFGYKLKQLAAIPNGVQYDEFVGALLREISRPILAPYNLAAGSSKDSNMASGVLDSDIYKGGQHAERLSCEDDVLCKVFFLWWNEAIRIPGYLGDDYLLSDRQYAGGVEHSWRWDQIGRDHTDPGKVASALETMSTGRFMTDSDIQEKYFNRSKEEWQEEVLEDDKFRSKLTPLDKGQPVPKPPAPPGGSKPPGKKGEKSKSKPAGKKAKASGFRPSTRANRRDLAEA
jgi:hypothetical protein